MSKIHSAVSAAQSSLSITQDYKECRDDGHGRLECAAHTAVLQVGHLGEVLSHTEQFTECRAAGNTTGACLAGVAAQTAIETGVEVGSVAMITTSIPTQYVPGGDVLATTLFSTGIVGLANAGDIGEVAGELTVSMYNYLTDHVPADAIDSTQPIVVYNESKQIAIKFEPQEVAFVKSLVHQTQQAIQLSQAGMRQLQNLDTSMTEFKRRFDAADGHYNEATRAVTMRISDISQLCENLRRVEFKQVEPQLIERLRAPIRTDYVDRYAEAERHNANTQATHAAVHYDSRDDSWGIQISYNMGYGGGNSSSSSSFGCQIL